MGATLGVAKLKLEQDIKQAFFDAYMTQYESNSVTAASKYDGETKKSMEKKAREFSESLAKDMATAIYDFVKEIGITITVPPTVIAPSGPCTGTIPMTCVKVS